MPTHELVTPVSTGEWSAYHDIRRTVLFEARGQFGVYDENRPDDRTPHHYPKLLVYGGEPVGAVRIDVEGLVATFRRVAIRLDVQRRGHGRVLLQLAQRFAQEAGCTMLVSFVAADAVGFYEDAGFAVGEEQSGGGSRTAVFMTKRLEAFDGANKTSARTGATSKTKVT